MATNGVTAREALAILLQKLHDADPALEERVRAAIDAGHDVEEQQQPATRRRRPRVYRRTVRLTDSQALEAAVDVLKAYFVEQALFINSATQDFQQAAVADSQQLLFGGLREDAPSETREGVGTEKALEIELQIETQITPADSPTLRIIAPDHSVLEDQQANIAKLEALLREVEE
jgi:hypothetical protein